MTEPPPLRSKHYFASKDRRPSTLNTHPHRPHAPRVERRLWSIAEELRNLARECERFAVQADERTTP